MKQHIINKTQVDECVVNIINSVPSLQLCINITYILWLTLMILTFTDCLQKMLNLLLDYYETIYIKLLIKVKINVKTNRFK